MSTQTLAADQSLANGAAGAALLAVEQALNGSGTWHDARTLIAKAAAAVDAGPHAALFYGAPALLFVLHAASTDGYPRYRAAARQLDGHIHRIARQRLGAAEARMASGRPAAFAEYDLFYGLTGFGVLLLRTAPGSGTLADILRYVTGLTMPRVLDGLEVPGWWAAHNPDPLLPTPGGHANFGMAHGAAGLLAFLSLAMLKGCTVDGQHETISYLTRWFGKWRQKSSGGPWWPQWITRDQLRSGRPGQNGPGRPSWCYGAAGIARALQLAAIAVGDTSRQQAAEQAMAGCLTGTQLSQITEPGLCHGLAGLYQTAARAARDALTPVISQHLPTLAATLNRHVTVAGNAGLLTGDTGVRLALETARNGGPPRSGWDSCLLIA